MNCEEFVETLLSKRLDENYRSLANVVIYIFFIRLNVIFNYVQFI